MNAYTVFSKVYDGFMKDIPYEKWGLLISDCLKKNGILSGKILDAGCGTGTFTIILKKLGYDMTGIDCSADMLKIAKNKTKKEGLEIQYECCDMRALDLNTKYAAAVSICDTMNYLEKYFDFVSALNCIYDTILKGGIFIFDLKTREYYEKLGCQNYTDTNETGTYIWENEYDAEENNNYYHMTFFIKGRHDRYTRYIEEHTQHSYTDEEVRKAIEESNFTLLEEFTKEERTYYILERN